MSKSNILVVEDEDIIRSTLRRLLERNGYSVAEAGSVNDAESRHDLTDFDLIVSDLRLPGAPGTTLISKAEGTPVLIMTSYASVRSAVESLKHGAVDYIAKPFDHGEMLDTIKGILATRRPSPNATPTSAATEIPAMIGRAPAMRDLYSRIAKVARTDTTVLIQGESGTGKELVARAIHELSPRADKPLISVNCAAIPDTLIESELFGHERGAFTGALANRTGLIEAADGGTLFLDEIGELPLEAQARLLRVLQEGEIRKVGAIEATQVDVRLISATHRDLATLSIQQQFRHDLFYRIAVMPLELPPLRDRGADILELADHFLRLTCKRFGRDLLELSPDAIQALTTHSWPGNVRELQNAIERAVILTEGDTIEHRSLGLDIELVEVTRLRPAFVGEADESAPAPTRAKPAFEPGEGLSLEDYFQQFVLEHQEHMSETELARKLGISRKCLWERRQRFGIPRTKPASKRSSTG